MEVAEVKCFIEQIGYSMQKISPANYILKPRESKHSWVCLLNSGDRVNHDENPGSSFNIVKLKR